MRQLHQDVWLMYHCCNTKWHFPQRHAHLYPSRREEEGQGGEDPLSMEAGAAHAAAAPGAAARQLCCDGQRPPSRKPPAASTPAGSIHPS